MKHSIRIFPSGPFGTNALLLVVDGKAAIIDPAPGSAPSLQQAIKEAGAAVENIFLTHTHWDHIGDCAVLKEGYNVPVWVHREDAENLEKPGSDRLPVFLNEPIPGVKPDRFLEDGQKIMVGDLELEVIHTPGHCPGLVCFYCKEGKFLITGDLLFRNGMGNLALPTGEPERMEASLARVAKLPPETVVYPGHGETTTIANELNWLGR